MPIKSFLSRRSLSRAAAKREKPHPAGRRSPTHLTSRVVIRKPVSWRHRALWGLGLTLLAVLAGYGLYAAGQFSAGYNRFQTGEQIDRLRTENADLRQRGEQLDAALKHTTMQLLVEQGARQTLEAQVRRLEGDLGRVNEDVALFENLFPSDGPDGRPAIRGFRVEPIAATGKPSAWRYRVLVMRGGQPREDFSGEFQLQVRYRLEGREVLAPSSETGRIAKPLVFQRYQRIEGQFQAPAGAMLLGALVRVVENGKSVAEYVYRP